VGGREGEGGGVSKEVGVVLYTNRKCGRERYVVCAVRSKATQHSCCTRCGHGLQQLKRHVPIKTVWRCLNATGDVHDQS
jgi:hypothetical protein